MAENYPFPIYFILLIITITRLISTVGKTEQWKSSSSSSLPIELSTNKISQKLINDPIAIEKASSDYGNLVHDLPAAVFNPTTVNDIVSLIKLSFNSSVPFPIAARGQGHSTRGQAMARDGVVVDMKALRENKRNNNKKNNNIKVFEDTKVGYYVDVGGEELWIDVLYETLEYGFAPVCWTDYLYLTIGGTLSNAGISGQTFRYGPQITTVHQLDVVTGKTEQWKSSSSSSLPIELSTNKISQKLINDPIAIEKASSDYGNLVHDLPAAVFNPTTVNDIVSLIKLSFNSSVPFPIAARGQGHSTRGQAMARDGVVVDMKALRENKRNNNKKNNNIKVFEDTKVGYYVDVGGEELWIDVLYETLEYGFAPVCWTDYLYLTIGGTLSNAGISGQTFRYGPQITTVHQLDVVTGKTEQWKSSSSSSLPIELSTNKISQKLINDPIAIEKASSDYGNLVHDLPAAVFNPTTVNDIVSLIKLSFNSSVPFPIAARGQGHSTRGQAMARDGVVVDMKALRENKRNNNKKNNNIKVFEDTKVGYYVDVGGEELWIDVLYETLEYGFAPVCWTDYLYLTIGGTLSNAGISGQTFRYGPQITTVHQLDVVTGKGEFVTCSKENNSELFHGVLGGLGQFGIITRARIALEPAPKRVKWVRLLYSDFGAFTKDQEHLISMKGIKKNSGLDYLEGMLLMHQGPINNWRSSFFPLSDHYRILSLVTQHSVLYCLEIAKYYDHHSENNVNKEIQVLLQGLNYIPGFYYEKNVTFVEFLNRVRSGELKLQSQGLWDVPHPWLNMFIPKSRIMDFNSGVFMKIIQKRNITTGPVLVYPMNRNKWDKQMSATIPDDEDDIFYTVGFLHSSGFDNWKAFDAQNKEILQFCNDAEIKYKLYLPHYSTQEEWTNHFGPKKWKTFFQRKYEFDPRMILSPGQRIFNNN